MRFDNNEQRRAFWHQMIEKYSPAEIEEALNTLHPDAARVLQLHYLMKYPLKDIGKIVNRSMTVVRNHHNRGIFKLHQYFERRNT